MYSSRIGGTTVSDARAARFSSAVLSGFIASQIAGVVMALLMIAAFAFGPQNNALLPVQVIGSYLFGDSALALPTVSSLLAAVLFHQGVCAAWGLAFGLVAALTHADVSRAGVVALGLAIGVASQVVDINLITPPLMERLWGHDLWAENIPTSLSWIGHVVFGLAFVSFSPIFRSLWLRFAGRGDLVARDPRIT